MLHACTLTPWGKLKPYLGYKWLLSSYYWIRSASKLARTAFHFLCLPCGFVISRELLITGGIGQHRPFLLIKVLSVIVWFGIISIERGLNESRCTVLCWSEHFIFSSRVHLLYVQYVNTNETSLKQACSQVIISSQNTVSIEAYPVLRQSDQDLH